MGFIHEFVRSGAPRGAATKGATDLPGGSLSRWNRAFGVSKEDGASTRHTTPSSGGGGTSGSGWTRSLTGETPATARLIQSLRSRSPGGWSDDRYEQSRHFLGIQYITIHRSCEQLAQGEFQVFRKDPTHPDGKRPVYPDDPPEGGRFCRPYDLVRLLQNPNRQDSFGDMMYRWNQQMDLTGKALTFVVPNKLGYPYEMYSIPTALAIPQAVSSPQYPDGYYRIQPVYPYGPFSSYPTPSTSVGAPIPAEWMMEFKYPHPLLRYDGYSPLTALRLHIDEVEAMDKSRWHSMRQVFNPTAVLNFENMEGAQPMNEAEIERIRADLESSQFGPDNVGKLFVATPGANLEQWGTKPVEMDYQSGWDQLVSFIMAGMGISKTAAGMVEGSSYSNLFATLKQFYWLTLDPKCQRFAAGITRTLAPFFGDDLFVEIRCRPINDHEIVHAQIGLGIQAQCLTKNEVRKMLGLHVSPEEWGTEIAGTSHEDLVMMQQEQEAMAAQAGAPPNTGIDDAMGENPNELGAVLDGLVYGARLEDAPTEASRPRSGPLATGSLGPRKSLSARFQFHKKSPKNRHKVFDYMGRELAPVNGKNGHANGHANGSTNGKH